MNDSVLNDNLSKSLALGNKDIRAEKLNEMFQIIEQKSAHQIQPQLQGDLLLFDSPKVKSSKLIDPTEKYFENSEEKRQLPYLNSPRLKTNRFEYVAAPDGRNPLLLDLLKFMPKSKIVVIFTNFPRIQIDLRRSK